MKKGLTVVTGQRIAVAISAVAVLAAVVVPSLASGSNGASASSSTSTIFIRGGSEKTLHFVGPKTITEGEPLQIVNQSNVRKVGPQTFSLVEASEIPKTKKERELCFKAGHICKAIQNWHHLKGKEPTEASLVEAGLEGWDTAGTVKTKGDSWYTGKTPGASELQRVNAGATAGAIVLTFMSAFDPSLQGKITVLPSH